MDRSSFLGCLSFLSSETFTTWPPPSITSQSNLLDGVQSDAVSLQALEDSYWLSLEPCRSSPSGNGGTVGPACFASSITASARNSSEGITADLSMCKFQMAIYVEGNSATTTTNAKATSPGSVSTNGTSTTTTTSQSPPKTPLRTGNSDVIFWRRSNSSKAAAVITRIFVRIDDRHCYCMDLRQLENMELQQQGPPALHANNEQETKEDNKAHNTSQQPKPHCLLLNFPTCRFRIFSSQDDQNAVHKELELVYQRLQDCWDNMDVRHADGIFPTNNWTNSFGGASNNSGNGSSTNNSSGHVAGSSNEAGQARHDTAIAAAATGVNHNQDHNVQLGSHQQPQNRQSQAQHDTNDGALRLLRQRQANYSKSRQCLQSLNTVLEMPAWIWSDGDSNKRQRRTVHDNDADQDDDNDVVVLREHLSDCLSSTADHLSASFWMNRHDKHRMIRFYTTQIQGHDQDMEQLLSEAFPRTLRGRLPASSPAKTPPEAAMKRKRQQQQHQSSPLPHHNSVASSSPQQPGTPGVTATTKATTRQQDVGITNSGSRSRQWLLLANETIQKQRQAIIDRHKLSQLPSRN